MHWPSAAPGAAAVAGERRRARRSGPAAAVSRPEARRGGAALEGRGEPSDARRVHRGDQVPDRADGAVPAEVGGAGLPARDRLGAQVSKVEPRRPDVRRSGRIVARRPAGGHLPARECPPDETMDGVPPSRARRSVRAEMGRRRERLPMCVDSLRITIVIVRIAPVECAARRFGRNHPDRQILRTAATADVTTSAGAPRRSEARECSRRVPQVSDSA